MPDAISRAVDILNEALERDADAITSLVNLRVPCNVQLAAHPLIRVGLYEDEHRVGVLGLLNGVLGDSPSGAIGAKGTRDERTGRFVRIRRFVDLRPEKTDVLA